MTKNILVVARRNQSEALRMAAGLTLLDDRVKVDVFGTLEDTPQVAEQREVLDFAGVPLTALDPGSSEGWTRLARDILEADVVYVA